MNRKIKIEVICFILIMSFIFLFSCTKKNGNSASQNQNEIHNNYEKIHFYCCTDEKYSTIDDYEELIDALNLITDNGVSCPDIVMTVQFKCDYMSDKTYLELKDQLDKSEGIDNIHEARRKLNEYSKKYHNSIFNNNIKTLDIVSYKSIKQIEYSPFVRVSLDYRNIDCDILEMLIDCENIVTLSLSYDFVSAPEASWNDTLDCADALEIVQNGTYTGDGIRIGISANNNSSYQLWSFTAV